MLTTPSSPHPIGSAPPILRTDDQADIKETHTSAREVSQGTFGNPQEQIDNFLQRWMATEVIRQSRIWDIVVPGSHDSGTYDCTHAAKGLTQRGLMEFIKSFVVTQDKHIYDQLMCGIRFLDLRICIDPLDGTKIPYCAHGGYRCVTLIEALLDVRKFLVQNPTEIVFVSCKPDAGFKSGRYYMSLGICDFWMTAILWDLMGDKLRSRTTVQELIDRKQQVIYFYSEVERYCPSRVAESSMHRMASQCSVKLETADSVLGTPALPRNAASMLSAEVAKQRKKIIRYESGEYYSHHKLSARHKKITFDGSIYDLFTGVLRNNVVSLREGETDDWDDGWFYDPEASSAWQIDRPKFGQDFAFKFRGGEVHAAAPLQNRSLEEEITEWSAALNMQASRFPKAPRDNPGPVRLRAQDAVRFKQMGLSRTFFDYPLRVKMSEDFLFVSYLKTGRTIITKSWGQTCENNAKFLCQKLKYWTQLHGKLVHRPAYRLRILAGEVTPPSPDFPQPGSELMKFWAQQSANALLFMPTGTKPNALICNKLLLSDILIPSITSKVNGVTHDFVSRKLVLTMLFHHVKYLRQFYAERELKTPPSLVSGSEDSGVHEGTVQYADDQTIISESGKDYSGNSQTQLEED